MSNQQISKSLHSVTSLQASEGGVSLCSLQGGTQADLFGQAARLANHSQQQETEKDKMMSDTCGQSFLTSLESANLQQSLASRLQQQLEQAGSTIYKLTWKQKTTPRQWPYCQRAASVPRTKGKGYSTQQDAWPTPMHTDGTKACNRYREGYQNGLGAIASTLDCWATPTARDYKNTGNLENYIFGSPTGRIRTDSVSTQAYLISGQTPKQSGAGTESTVRYQLNPRFSLWLMGYPIEWAYCAERVMPSSRKRRQK